MPGILGAAQYSLLKNQAVGVLARENIYFREASSEEICDATPDEILEDLAQFGMAVVGSLPTEASQATIPAGTWAGGRIYLGSHRLEKIVMLRQEYCGV